MKIVADAPGGMRNQFIRQILQLVQDDYDIYRFILGYLGNLPDHEARQIFINQALRLVTPTTSREDRIKVANLLKELSSADLRAFTDGVVRISDPLYDVINY